MEGYSLRQLSKEKKEAVFQSKYEYYRVFNTGLIVVSVLSYLLFFFTDCGIFGRFAYETLLPRTFIIVPFIAYLIMAAKIKSYKIMVFSSYLMIHLIIWGTDWATYLLPDRQHAISGMIIMNLIFVCAGFCAPFKYSIIAHLLLVVDITIAHQFIHYDNISMMYMFNLPCIFAIIIMHYLMQRIFLEQYFMREKLQNMAVLDQLTAVYNRNKLKEIVDPDTEELTFQEGTRVSALLMDIDFFKKINDKYGHEAGDKVLINLAQLLKSFVRDIDYVIRWGGEEFLIIMPNCAVECAVERAEQIRQAIEKDDNRVCKMTVSIGVSEYNGGDFHALVREADEALYKAKADGRNKVVAFTE